MVEMIVIRPVRIGGSPRAVGERVEVDEQLALELLNLGKAKPAVDDEFSRRLKSGPRAPWTEAPSEARRPPANWAFQFRDGPPRSWG